MAFVAGVAALIAVRTAGELLVLGRRSCPARTRASLTGPVRSRSWREMTTRMLGLLVDQEFGLLLYAPVYACALAGAFRIGKTNRAWQLP